MAQYKFDLNISKMNAARTLFNKPHNYKTTLNAGDLVPVYVDEVLPGDTFKQKISAVVRELTLLNPVMDNSYLEFNVFYAPMRILWSHTKQFFGENDTGIWTQTKDYVIPNDSMDLAAQENILSSCSIGDYLGLPVGDFTDQPGGGSETVNYLILRMYAMIWNNYYMAETTQAPVLFSIEDNVSFGPELSRGYNSKPLKVNRFSDLFTTALPQPQKGPNVPFLDDYLPVVPRGTLINYEDLAPGVSSDKYGTLYWGQISGDEVTQFLPSSNSNVTINSGSASSNPAATITSAVSGNSSVQPIIPANLYASTINGSLKDINSLRIAIATQHYFEQLARGGSRYREFIKGFWNVDVQSEVINIPQYLGRVKKLINVNQVLATADSANATLGTTGAYSHTAIRSEHLFTASFSEPGYIMILCHIRTDNTYSQGLPKMFSKKTKWDIYNPAFANIGNVEIKNKEIMFQNNSQDDEAFGFQEAFYEYKFKPNMLTGYMRPGVNNSFSSWSYGRVFSSLPVLNSDFTTQTAEEVDRTIAVESSLTNQFKLDLFIESRESRIMPIYSVPGLNKI